MASWVQGKLGGAREGILEEASARWEEAQELV